MHQKYYFHNGKLWIMCVFIEYYHVAVVIVFSDQLNVGRLSFVTVLLPRQLISKME